ncbi:DUF551 domain-containing protein [Klebsiella oxytoca]|uniref:DUF551 domain-containing protein n=1 Tax=Klebsiella oxytoca TaxID=571 RepID=UPI000666B90F|nr:DUF551 domain-containing protein [Klebsiella oxytoca]
MTNNQLNRERLEKIKSWRETYGAESNVMLPAEEAEELARMALATMDSEPVAWRWRSGPDRRWHLASRGDLAGEVEPLYRHAQQPVVPDDVLVALQKVARIRLDLNDFDGDRRGIADCLGDAEEALIEVVNRRAAILQELQKSAGTANNCRSNKNVQDLQDESRCGIKSAPPLDFLPKNTESLTGNSPAQSDCCPAQNVVAPAQNQGWIPVSERMPESNGVYFGWDGKRVLEVNCFFGGFSANQFIHGEITHWMPLPAAPQEVKSES